MGGLVDGWMGGRAVLGIAYSNQKLKGRGSILWRNIKIWLFQNVEKIQDKVEMAKETGYGNELKSFPKIGGKNEMSFN